MFRTLASAAILCIAIAVAAVAVRGEAPMTPSGPIAIAPIPSREPAPIAAAPLPEPSSQGQFGAPVAHERPPVEHVDTATTQWRPETKPAVRRASSSRSLGHPYAHRHAVQRYYPRRWWVTYDPFRVGPSVNGGNGG
jgi:hypothetical protein